MVDISYDAKRRVQISDTGHKRLQIETTITANRLCCLKVDHNASTSERC